MTKLTNCSIIASRGGGRRSSDGGLRGACTVRRTPARPHTNLSQTNQLSLPEFLPPPHQNSPNRLQPRGVSPNSPARVASDPRETARGSGRPGARNARREPRGPASGERGGRSGKPPPRPPLRRRRRGTESGGGSETAETGRE